MLHPRKKYYSVEDYLALEDKADYKSEYHDGEIVLMAGGTGRHNRIAGNIYNSLSNAFADRDCETFSFEMKVQIKARNSYLYPDVLALCGPIDYVDGREDMLDNPMVVFEVLSKSTQKADRTYRFEWLKTLPSFQAYVLIDQDDYLVERFVRTPQGFWYSDYFGNLEDVVKLAAIDFEIDLATIYRKVVLEDSSAEGDGTTLNP